MFLSFLFMDFTVLGWHKLLRQQLFLGSWQPLEGACFPQDFGNFDNTATANKFILQKGVVDQNIRGASIRKGVLSFLLQASMFGTNKVPSLYPLNNIDLLKDKLFLFYFILFYLQTKLYKLLRIYDYSLRYMHFFISYTPSYYVNDSLRNGIKMLLIDLKYYA